MDQAVTLELGSSEEATRDLLIYNAQGTVVAREKISLNIGQNQIQLAVQDLPSGIHHILISGDHLRFSTGKFTILN